MLINLKHKNFMFFFQFLTFSENLKNIFWGVRRYPDKSEQTHNKTTKRLLLKTEGRFHAWRSVDSKQEEEQLSLQIIHQVLSVQN